MSEKALGKILRGLEEAKAYLDGEREGYQVTVPPTVDVKSIRRGLKMTQAAFSASFGFSLDAVKHWEGGRRTPEVPARAYLTVIPAQSVRGAGGAAPGRQGGCRRDRSKAPSVTSFFL